MSRALTFLDALPSYFGGKRRLLGHIAKVVPPPAEAPVLLDAFLGGGSVSLWSKARGHRVVANDVAERSVIVGRALVENDRVKLSREDVTRLFAAPTAEPAFVERVYGGEVVPVRHARFLDVALDVARATPGAKGWLLRLLCLRYVLALRPMGNFGARTIVKQIDDGAWESVNPTFLRENLARRMEAHPRTLCEDLRVRINAGVLGTGLVHEVHQGDAVAFLREAEGSVAYLDPPYGGTSAYESALRPLDSILAGRVVESTPSRFSGRGTEPLDELLEACRHIPHLVLSYGNAALDPHDLERLVARHRHDVRMEVLRYQHLAGLASEESRERNREVLISAGRGR